MSVGVPLPLVLAALLATGLAPLPPQPPGLEWPGERWPEGELPADLDRAAFETELAGLFEPRGRGGFADTRALLIVQGGRIVFERYAPGFGPASRFQSWSVAKSVTNALIGIRVRQGALELDAAAPVPEWGAADDPRGEITLRHLLQMRSGLAIGDDFGGEGSDGSDTFLGRLMFGEGAAAPEVYAAGASLEAPPGEHWAYSTGSSVLLAAICGRSLGGGPERMREFMTQELFRPLGMRSVEAEFAASGVFWGGAHVHATARDWARFGYLYLRDGVWAGRRILPEGWVDFSRTPAPVRDETHHAAHFWTNRGSAGELLPDAPPSTFGADGAFFQTVAVVPTKDLVAVRLGENQGSDYEEAKARLGRLVSAFPDRP